MKVKGYAAGGVLGLCLLTLAQSQDLTAFGINAAAQAAGEVNTAAAVTGGEQALWADRPLPLTLQVGVERPVTFPAPVRLGIPTTLTDKLRTQSVAGTVHWLAQEPFGTTRIQARALSTGRTYLLDLRAVAEGGEVMPLTIIDPGLADALQPPAPPTDQPPATEAAEAVIDPATDDSPPTYDYVTLTRFAAQQLYAPERLLTRLSLPGVTRVPVRRQAPDLYRGGAVTAEPLTAWTDGTLHITAVRLSNQTDQAVTLDPRDLRGRWLARALLVSELAPRNDALGRDRAVVFLLSPLPFAEALP